MTDSSTDQAGHATFVFIVFIVFGITSFLCLSLSFLRWRKRLRVQGEQQRLLEAHHENHRLARINQEEEREDTKLRSSILRVMFPSIRKVRTTTTVIGMEYEESHNDLFTTGHSQHFLVGF